MAAAYERARSIPIQSLDDLVEQANVRAARPRKQPREVYAQVLEDLAGGAGLAGATYALGALFNVPWLMNSALYIGAIGGLAALAARSLADNVLDGAKAYRYKKVAERSLKEYWQERELLLFRLERAADKLDDMERAQDQMKRDLDTERVLRASAQEQLQQYKSRGNYVKAQAAPEPQHVRDAHEILRRWYANAGYLSRPKAEEIGWSQERHAEAAGLLKDAGILVQNVKQVRIVPATQEAAMQQLSDHLIRVKAQAEPLEREVYAGDYVDLDLG